MQGAVNHHEMWAKEATKFGGGAKSTYGQAVEGNTRDFAQALSQGVAPQGPSSLLSRGYGNVTNVVGTSQAQIGRNLGAVQSAEVNYQVETN